MITFSRCLALLLLAGSASAATYYVDFDGGSDSNIGTQVAPFKHVPGDANATGTAASTTLAAGDIVVLKGGVNYKGKTTVQSSSVTYRSDAAWGTGKAIFDGSELYAPTWTQCTGSGDVRGNPNWANIWYATPPAYVTNSFSLLIYNGTNQMYWSQDPNPTDPLHFAVTSQWNPVAQADVTATTVRDTGYFTSADSTFYRENYVMYWGLGSILEIAWITGFNTSTDTVTNSTISPNDRDSYVSIVNNPYHIDTPGEYAVSTNDNRLWMWPPGGLHPTNFTWSFGKLSDAFVSAGKTNVTWSGLKAMGYYSNPWQAGYAGTFVNASGVQNLTVTNCEVTLNRSLNRSWVVTMVSPVVGGTNKIVNSAFYELLGTPGVLGGGDNFWVISNYFSRLGGTMIYANNSTNAIIEDNIVQHGQGIHASGAAVFYGKTPKIRRNKFFDLGILMSYEGLEGMDVISSTFNANGLDQRILDNGCYTTQPIRFVGNTFVNSSGTIMLALATDPAVPYVFVGNIIHGGGPGLTAVYTNITQHHNLYTSFAHYQSAGAMHATDRTNWVPSSLFIDMANNDLRLKAGANAIDTGTNLTVYGASSVDLAGTARGDAWSIGAYEDQGESGLRYVRLRHIGRRR